MKQALLAAVAVVCMASAAQAERFSAVTGTKLLEVCASRDKGQQGDCTAYIDGVSDAASFYQALRPRDGSKGPPLPEYVCVPNNVTGVQLKDAVVGWAKTRADLLQRPAVGVVLRALNALYACPGEQARR